MKAYSLDLRKRVLADCDAEKGDTCVNNARKPWRRRGTCVTVEKRGALNLTRGRVSKNCSFLLLSNQLMGFREASKTTEIRCSRRIVFMSY